MSKRYTLLQGIAYILLITFVLSGLPALGWWGYDFYLNWRAKDPKNLIVAIVQKSSEKEALKNAYLADLLRLSVDEPTNLFHLNVKEGEKLLLQSPLIKKVKVRKISPGTVYVDYEMRKPIAFLGDYTNTAIDDEGVIFPFKPFFTPKLLPEIYLGIHQKEGDIESVPWGARLDFPQAKQALKILKTLHKICPPESLALLRIDMMNSDASSYGLREIVITLEEHIEKKENDQVRMVKSPIYLRLNRDDLEQAIGNFLELRKSVKSSQNLQSPVIDLRIPNFAFLSQGG